MDSRDIPQPPQPQLQPPLGMLMSDYHNPNAAAIMGTTSTSQSIHHRQNSCSPAPRQTHQHQKEQKTLESLGFASFSSIPTRFGIDQSQNQNQNQQQQVKRKRGRPRKYGPDDSIALGLVPPGFGKKQLNSLGTAGSGITPHVIEVNAGEDIASKVIAFSEQGPRTVCILSATGAVSTMTLYQASNPSRCDIHKGRFEIITLSGSFLTYEVNGSTNRSGSLTVALAGSEGQMLGGLVVGPLVAATKVQVIVGSFVAEAKKPKQRTVNIARGRNTEPASAPANLLNFGLISQRPSIESIDENEAGSSSVQRDNNNSGNYGNSVAQQQQLRQHHVRPNNGQ